MNVLRIPSFNCNDHFDRKKVNIYIDQQPDSIDSFEFTSAKFAMFVMRGKFHKERLKQLCRDAEMLTLYLLRWYYLDDDSRLRCVRKFHWLFEMLRPSLEAEHFHRFSSPGSENPKYSQDSGSIRSLDRCK